MPKRAGISDEMRLTITPSAPEVRVTNFTQLQLKTFIGLISKLPAMQGFRIITSGEHGLQFIQSIMGKGSAMFKDKKNRYRQRELMIIQFEVEKGQGKQVVSKEIWAKIIALREAIKAMPQLESLEFDVWDRIYWTNYDIEDDSSPHRFSLTFEYYPEAQREFDLKTLKRKSKEAVKAEENLLSKALKADEIKERVKDIVKEMK